jgi:Cu-Zn family superoxide dismutase
MTPHPRESHAQVRAPKRGAVIKSVRVVVLAGGVVVAGCSSPPVQTTPAPAPAPVVAAPPPRPVPRATAAAIVRDVSGRQVGALQFAETYAGVLITGSIGDLGLGGHAVHIHSVGKCQAPFLSAGGHFNPTNRRHGYKSANGPHLGDLPNLDLPAAGVRRFEMLLPGVMLRGPNGVLDSDGASIVVDSGRDDYVTEPEGNSGGRIACGVIVLR